MNDKNNFLIPAVIFTVAVSIVGGFLATRAQTAAWLRSTPNPALQVPGDAKVDGNTILGSVATNTTMINGLVTTTGGAILNTGVAPIGLIVANGNVGIGTQTPDSQYALDVVGKIRSTGGFVFPDGTTQLTASSGGSGSLPLGANGQTLRHNGTDWVADGVIYNDGTQVGIGGATLPGYKLNVTGALNATTLRQGGSDVQIRVVNTCVAGTAIRLISPSGNVTCESTGAAGDGLGTNNTGTTGYIPKWTTNNTVLGNSIIQEGSGGIGIGASPVSAIKLSAQGTNAGDGGIAGYSSGVGIGVYGSSNSGIGVRGNSTSGQGIYGSGSTQGVFGYSAGGIGVSGQSDTGWAGYFSGNVYSSGNVSVAGRALIGYEIVSVSSTGLGHFDTDVGCPAGKVVLGGGCENSTSDSTAISSNNPVFAQNKWHCRTRDVVTTTSRTVTAYAICARMGN